MCVCVYVNLETRCNRWKTPIAPYTKIYWNKWNLLKRKRHDYTTNWKGIDTKPSKKLVNSTINSKINRWKSKHSPINWKKSWLLPRRYAFIIYINNSPSIFPTSFLFKKSTQLKAGYRKRVEDGQQQLAQLSKIAHQRELENQTLRKNLENESQAANLRLREVDLIQDNFNLICNSHL